MANRWKQNLNEKDVTHEDLFLNRRRLIKNLASVGITGIGLISGTVTANAKNNEKVNNWEEITSYNNFYEFGTSKDDPLRFAHKLKTKPWSIVIDGLVDKPGVYALEDILGKMIIEERIYRLRCVEGWSMIIPWNGFELADLLNLVGIKNGAKYVAFETVLRPDEMPGVAYPVLDWPYVEGLRIDEAMHPLTLMANGIYGKEIPNQNGAPLRLVVPWKYGFKSIKSIVRITLMDTQPPTSWNKSNPGEYGFYSNVNPEVDHPRWSQAYERAIGGGLFSKRKRTLMFNGYAKDVANMYDGMDLKKFY